MNFCRREEVGRRIQIENVTLCPFATTNPRWMIFMNRNELRGNNFFKKERYNDALIYYRKAIRPSENPSPEVFIRASICLEKIYEAKEKKAKLANTKLEIGENEKTEKIIDIMKKGVDIYPQEYRLWFILAGKLAIYEHDIPTLFTAAENFAKNAKEITERDVKNIFSKVLFFGGLEPCLIAADRVLQNSTSFCQIEYGENILAKILATFGPSICPIGVVQRFVLAWDPSTSYWYSGRRDDHSKVGRYIRLLRRADVREQILNLPEFSFPYLDGLAIIFKIMVNWFNESYSTVKKILEDNIERQDLGLHIKFIQEIAGYISEDAECKLAIGKDLGVDFSSFVLETPKEEEIENLDQHKKYQENKEKYRQLLRDLSTGIYSGGNLSHDIIPEYPSKFLGLKGDPKKSWEYAVNCLRADDPEGAIRLLKAFLDIQNNTVKLLLGSELEVLFALLYSLKRFEEGKKIASLIIKGRIKGRELMDIFEEEEDDECHLLEKEIEEVLSFEPEEDESSISHRIAREQALMSLEGLMAYINQYSYAIRDIVKEYVKDSRRALEKVNSFLDYLFLRGAEYLGVEDVDEGTEKIINLINVYRDDIRREIPKASFDKAWKIIAIVKRIGAVVGFDFLRSTFQNTLDLDEDFKDLIADELIKKDWYQDNDLKKEHQAFVMWITLGKLGLSNYSYLFSETESQKTPKKKKAAKSSNATVSAEELVKQTQEPTEVWSFFVSTGPDSVDHIIEPTTNAFNNYFSNDLMVKGEDILDKLSYLLMLESYQRSRLPGIEVIYEGYRKLKRGAVRIFWKIDNQNKALHFFVKNRKEAYKK